MEAEFQGYEENRQWLTIYQNVNKCASRLKYTVKEARKSENRELNRYSDVVPFDETRVVLQKASTTYINASYVEVTSANRKYILTQGPLINTSGHFWLMIWEQKSKAILMLNNLIEAGQLKCHQYWPNGLENHDSDDITFEDTSLKVKLKRSQIFDYYVLRTFDLIDLVSKESREVLQFHYTHWPDFDLPRTSDSFLEFLFAVRESGSLDITCHGPAVIHCSAGIGRSGTFALVDSCLVLIEKNNCLDSINIIDRLLDLRKYRMGLIQTSDQLRFSFLAIIQGSKKLLKNLDNLKNSTKKKLTISRSLGVNESEDAEGVNEIELNRLNDEDSLNDEEEKDEQDDDQNHLLNCQILQNKKESTNAHDLRDAKRRKTMETIERIKRKQKETEERLKSKEKWLTYLYKTSIFVVGIAVCVGVYIFYKKPDALLLNFE